MSFIIAITGGIGAGKSVISNIVVANGHEVYDCDREAKIIMDSSPLIHGQLNENIHPQVVIDGIIDRQLLSSIVFSDKEKLKALNDIVHQHVVSDILEKSRDSSQSNPFFLETAILTESHLDRIVDRVWYVTAPLDIRINRVIKRNQCTRDQVESRIRSQVDDVCKVPHLTVDVIDNDGINPVLPRVLALLSKVVNQL